jgi:hypothetical protein
MAAPNSAACAAPAPDGDPLVAFLTGLRPGRARALRDAFAAAAQSPGGEVDVDGVVPAAQVGAALAAAGFNATEPGVRAALGGLGLSSASGVGYEGKAVGFRRAQAD